MLSYFKAVALGLVLGTLGGCFLGSTRAQHIHPDEAITDPNVANFYSTWMRPPQRAVSCCGLGYLHKWTGTWARLPASVIESNHVDPRESPSTENHVCASELYPDIVYCAVLASGT